MFGKGFRRHSKHSHQGSVVEGSYQQRAPVTPLSDILDGYILPDDFFTHQTAPIQMPVQLTEQFSAQEIADAQATPFSAFVDRMYLMDQPCREKATKLAKAAGSMSVSGIDLERDYSLAEFRFGPDYLVYDSSNRSRPAYQLSKLPNSNYPSILFNLACEGADDELNRLRDRGFVYVEFIEDVAND